VSQEEFEDEGMFVEREVIHDRTFVTHFFPPEMYENRDN
jgi:hypothetical protein